MHIGVRGESDRQSMGMDLASTHLEAARLGQDYASWPSLRLTPMDEILCTPLGSGTNRRQMHIGVHGQSAGQSMGMHLASTHLDTARLGQDCVLEDT